MAMMGALGSLGVVGRVLQRSNSIITCQKKQKVYIWIVCISHTIDNTISGRRKDHSGTVDKEKI